MDTPYIFGHLLGRDIAAAVIFFLLRKMFDLYMSHQKVTKRNEKWTVKQFYRQNGIRYGVSFFAAVGLLVALPETVAWITQDIMKTEFTWNTGFSAAIGYAPVELFLLVKKKVRKKANEHIDKV